MSANLTILAIIPARGGSKGISGKNIRPLCGRPLIAWTIEAARQSNSLSQIIVSTDDSEIAHIAQAWGAEVPFLRPAELARDDTPGFATVLHTIEWIETTFQYQPDLIILLQPTSPLRTAQDIQAAIRLHYEKGADSVVSICPVHQHPFWMKQLDEEGRMRDFIAQIQPVSNRQDLSSVYALNGAIYLARRDVLKQRKTWYTERTYGYVMPAERSLDIDTLWDWRLVEILLTETIRDSPK